MTALLDLTILGTSDTARGVGRYAIDLAHGLAGLGSVEPEVVAVTELPWIGLPALATDLNEAVARCIDGDGPVRSYWDWQWRLRLRLGAACRAAGAGLVHTVHAGATPLVDVGCARVTTCLDLIPLIFPKHYAGWKSGFHAGRRRLDWRRYHSADHVIAISRATADDLMRLLEVPASKITVVHLSVDHDRFRPDPLPSDRSALERLGLCDTPYVLSVGALEWRKNVPGTIDAFARARRRVPELKFVWAGRWPEQGRAEIEAFCERLGVRDAVVLTGFVSEDELAALYRGAQMLLFLSRYEGFGNPPIEAMASGCPLITGRNSSLLEVAEDAAIAVDTEDYAAAADAIVALQDEAERRRLKAAGLERARHFSNARMAAETLDVYRFVSARR